MPGQPLMRSGASPEGNTSLCGGFFRACMPARSLLFPLRFSFAHSLPEIRRRSSNLGVRMKARMAGQVRATHARGRGGFTLIEMLVVIGIMVTIATMALPAILKARDSSRSMHCMNNLRQLGVGIMRYYDTNKAYPPYRWEDPKIVNKYGVVRPRWQWIIADFAGRPAQNPDMILAAGPSDPTYTQVPLDNEIFLCPSLSTPDSASIRNGAYGYNFQYLGNSRNLVDGDIATPFLNFPIKDVRDPSRTIAFGDSRGGGLPHGGHSMTLDPPHMRLRPAGSGNVASPSPATLPGFDPYGPDETGTDIVIYFSPAEARHSGRANVVFLDGHCETLTLEQLGYVVVNGVAQPQTTTLLPWGDNRYFTGWGRDETSPYYGVDF